MSMSNQTRGHAIYKRRVALGLDSLHEFAQATGVSRQTIARAEKGDPSVTETTYTKLETWLDRFEEETGSPMPKAVPEPGIIEYRLFGADLVVKGPVANIAEMEASVARLIDRYGRKPGE
jgi:transcriptional regulator with XRE-family HTH domain